jgi:hypothetical protein
MPFLPFIPFADCVDCYWDFIQQGVPWGVTMTIKAPGAVDAGVLVDLFNHLDAWWTNDMAANVSSNCTLRAIKLTDLTSQSGPTHIEAPTTPAGTLSGNVLPAQTAMVVSLYTPNRGRSFRGRNYWAGRVFADQDTVTQWGSTRLIAVGGAYDDLISQLGSDGYLLGVASRYFNGVRRTTGVFTAVSDTPPKAPIATQRRRLL